MGNDGIGDGGGAGGAMRRLGWWISGEPKALSTDRAMICAGFMCEASGPRDLAITAAGERRFLLRDLRGVPGPGTSVMASCKPSGLVDPASGPVCPGNLKTPICQTRVRFSSDLLGLAVVEVR